jgi:hypothetical protein
MHQKIDQDDIPTQVCCPRCARCKVCAAIGMVTLRVKNIYEAKQGARVQCPRCAAYTPSDECAICEGDGTVTRGVETLWQMHNAGTRRPSQQIAVLPKKE